MLFFDNVTNLKLFDLPLAVLHSFKKRIEIGDCYYIKENEVAKLKTPMITEHSVTDGKKEHLTADN